MLPSQGLTYREAGVDIDAGNDLVDRIKKFAPAIGGFAGMLPIDEDRFLVATTDGVGTKLALAIELGRFEGVGRDLVAMCVNDLVAVGARPMGFLDYYATGKLDVDQAEGVVRGIAAACEEAGCVLMGGETAEMPGFYPPGMFDLAGFATGIVRRAEVIDGTRVKAGHQLIGLPSSGPHSNGYSLIGLIRQRAGLELEHSFADGSLADALLAPTRIYVKTVLALAAAHPIDGVAHITGGGFENLARMVPKGLQAKVHEGSWVIPEIFNLLQTAGNVSNEEMRRTFNMGIGLALAVPPEAVAGILAAVPDAFVFGEIIVEQAV